jgi:prepilin peptidase CpaA
LIPSDRVALWGLLAVALLVSVVTDLASRRIPDAVTYPTTALALLWRLWHGGIGDMDTGLVSGLVAAAGCAAFFAVVAWRGGIGWGDVKLMLAVGAAFGYPLAMSAALFIGLVGFLQALVTIIWKGAVWSTIRRTLLRFTKQKTTSEEPNYIPYGVAIALGCFWAMWWEGTQ